MAAVCIEIIRGNVAGVDPIAGREMLASAVMEFAGIGNIEDIAIFGGLAGKKVRETIIIQRDTEGSTADSKQVVFAVDSIGGLHKVFCEVAVFGYGSGFGGFQGGKFGLKSSNLCTAARFKIRISVMPGRCQSFQFVTVAGFQYFLTSKAGRFGGGNQ